MVRKAAIFDRDGTLMRDEGYVSDPRDVVLVEGARRVVEELKRRGFLLCMATNQSGIGRGYFNESDFWRVTGRLEDLLGVSFDAVEMCPHHPEDLCKCRKPSPHMILSILDRCGCGKESSFFAGDKRSDAETGVRSGVRTFWIRDGETDAVPGELPRGEGRLHVLSSIEEILAYV